MKPKKFWPLALLLLGQASVEAQTNLALLVSQPGDYVGQGQTYVTTNVGDVVISGTPIELTLGAFGYWIYFSGPDTTPLGVGTYTNAASWPGNGARPGLSVLGNGRGCNSCGEFRIFEIHTNANGDVDRFWATFTQICGCSGAPLTGEIRYNSQLAPPVPVPRTLHVPGDFATIQAALNDASLLTTDTILVGPGVYREMINFLGKSVRVLSTDGPMATFITSPLTPAGAQLRSGETRESILCGFSITNCTVGIEAWSSSPTLVSNIVENCDTGIDCERASPAILSNQIVNCRSEAIYLSGFGSLPTQIFGNSIQSNGTAMGMSDGHEVAVYNNIIQGNVYGGLFMGNDTDADIYQNLIVENGGTGIDWAVPYGIRGPRIANNTICNNTGPAISAGGYGGNVPVVNNVIVGDPAISVGGYYYYYNQAPLFRSNNIFSWTGNIYAGSEPTPDFSENSLANPSFVCPNHDDYHLLAGSPGLNIGDNDFVTNSLMTDLDGSLRFVSGVIDAGVFEFDPRVQAAACAYVYCPSNIVVSAAAGQDGVPVEYPAPIASPGATVICSPPSGTVFHPGTNIVHCSAVIGTTNVDTCTFTVAVLSPPPNDEFENATVISSLPYEDTIDTSVATRSDSDSNCSSGATVWYKIKSKKNQEIIASTEGSGYYASVSVFTPSGKELKSIGCDYFVSTRFKALAGHTYYIMIGAANGSDKGRLHFTAVSQPVLKVQAGIAPTAFVSEGAVWYHGTITVSRPTIVDLFATVWISVGPYNIMVDTFSYSAECDGKSTGWTFARYPAPTLPNPLVWVVLTYRAADELAPPPGRAERTIKILSSSPR